MVASKQLILAGIGFALVVAAGVSFLLRGQPNEPELVISTPTAFATPTPEVPGTLLDPSKERDNPDLGGRYPIVSQLPHETSFWRLQIASEMKDGILPLEVIVTVLPEDNIEEKINSQKPFVEEFIRSTGQAEGTYTVEYRKQISD